MIKREVEAQGPTWKLVSIDHKLHLELSREHEVHDTSTKGIRVRITSDIITAIYKYIVKEE
jgi:hypothetical protein